VTHLLGTEKKFKKWYFCIRGVVSILRRWILQGHFSNSILGGMELRFTSTRYLFSWKGGFRYGGDFGIELLGLDFEVHTLSWIQQFLVLLSVNHNVKSHSSSMRGRGGSGDF